MPDIGSALARDFLAPAVESQDLQREHGGNVFFWARKLGLDPKEIIDFSASINPLGPPRSARKAHIESYADITSYPDSEGAELKEALARQHGMKSDDVCLGNGSTQLIYLLCRALRPRKALVVLPAFSEYSNALKLIGTEVQSYFLSPEHEFRLPLEEFMEGWEKDLDMVFLSNPNSVTGEIISKAAMEEIAGLALRRKILLAVDEAFMDFVESESVKELIQRNPYLIVLRSLTKYYGVPGLRIGYLLGNEKIIHLLALQQEPWSVNLPAQRVALACLGESTFSSRTTQWLQREKPFLLKGLAKVKGLHPYPSQVNFVLVGLDRIGINATELRSYLLQKSILIRSCDSFSGLGSKYFRVAVRLRKDNTCLLKGLEEIMAPL